MTASRDTSVDSPLVEPHLGPLPEEWQVVRLGKTATFDWGNTSLTKSLYKPSGYVAFRATGPDGFLDFYEQSGEAVIVSAVGARCGKCFYASGRWTAIKNTIIIKSEQACSLFLYFYLDDENICAKSGTGQPFISVGKAKQVPFPLPRLPSSGRFRICCARCSGQRRLASESSPRLWNSKRA